jgi:hypothetical protein
MVEWGNSPSSLSGSYPHHPEEFFGRHNYNTSDWGAFEIEEIKLF